MRDEGKVSKIAICEKSQGFILACHLDYITPEAEKEFTELCNKGFTVKVETIAETHNRKFVSYKDCVNKTCKCHF